jgi:hypothetical protein
MPCIRARLARYCPRSPGVGRDAVSLDIPVKVGLAGQKASCHCRLPRGTWASSRRGGSTALASPNYEAGRRCSLRS